MRHGSHEEMTTNLRLSDSAAMVHIDGCLAHFERVHVSPGGGGNFLMSGIWVCATDQGRFFTSKNPEQAPNFEVLLQNRPYLLKVYSRTGSFFDNLVSNTWLKCIIPVAFSVCFLQPDVFTFVLLYLASVSSFL